MSTMTVAGPPPSPTPAGGASPAHPAEDTTSPETGAEDAGAAFAEIVAAVVAAAQVPATQPAGVASTGGAAGPAGAVGAVGAVDPFTAATADVASGPLDATVPGSAIGTAAVGAGVSAETSSGGLVGAGLPAGAAGSVANAPTGGAMPATGAGVAGDVSAETLTTAGSRAAGAGTPALLGPVSEVASGVPVVAPAPTSGASALGPGDAHLGTVTMALSPVPAAATGPAAATTAAPAPSYVQTPTPAAQLAAVILPLRDAGDGVHRVVLQLHPEDLGQVQVRVELRGHELHLQLAGASDATRDVLRAALGDLRRDLAAQGFSATTINVSADSPGAFASYDGSGGSAHHGGSGRFGPRVPAPAATVTTPSLSIPAASSGAGIDVRV